MSAFKGKERSLPFLQLVSPPSVRVSPCLSLFFAGDSIPFVLLQRQFQNPPLLSTIVKAFDPSTKSNAPFRGAPSPPPFQEFRTRLPATPRPVHHALVHDPSCKEEEMGAFSLSFLERSFPSEIRKGDLSLLSQEYDPRVISSSFVSEKISFSAFPFLRRSFHLGRDISPLLPSNHPLFLSLWSY